MVLRNFIELVPGEPATLHFTGGTIVEKTIVDPLTGREKKVRALVLEVDRLNGEPVSAQFSTLSEKLASQLFPFLERGDIQNYEFTILVEGEGFTRTYSVEVHPYGG